MSLFLSTHHTFVIEPWNEHGLHVLDLDTQQVRLLLRDKKEIDTFVQALRSAEQGFAQDGACAHEWIASTLPDVLCICSRCGERSPRL